MADEDRVIHEAMGLCWHEWPKLSKADLFQVRMRNTFGLEDCLKCEVHRFGRGVHENPDYAKDLRPVFEWMRDRDSHGEPAWYKFERWYDSRYKYGVVHFISVLDTTEQRDLIANWIESTRE